jgi:AcrR family transcriptional regulator
MARIAGNTRSNTEGKLIKAALYCLAKQGLKGATFQKVAAQAGVTPALVVHYFKSSDELYPRVLEYVISEARAETVQAVEKGEDPVQKLRNYFRTSIDFFRNDPDKAKIYLLLYHLASFDERYKAISTEIKQIAIRRIEAILESGEQGGQFKVKHRALTARMIHNSLVGLLLSILTDHQPHPDSSLMSEFDRMILTHLGN